MAAQPPDLTPILPLNPRASSWLERTGLILLYSIPLFAFVAFSSLSAYWVQAPYDGWRIYELLILVAFSGYLICSKNTQASFSTLKNNKLISLILVFIAILVACSSYYAQYSQRAIADAALYFLLASGVYAQATLLRKYPSIAPKIAAWLAVLPMLTLIFLPIAIYGRFLGGDGVWTQSFTNIRMLDDAVLPCLFLLWQCPAWLSSSSTKTMFANRALHIIIYFLSTTYLLSFWLHGARANLLAILVSLIFIAMLRRDQWRSLYLPISTILASGVVFLIILQSNIASGSGSSISRTGNSGRIELWNKAIQLWWQQPILGIGGDNFALNDPFFLVMHPHNIAIQFLTEWGIAGVLTMLLLLPLAVFIIKNRHTLPTFALAAVLALGINAMLSGTLIYPVSQLLALWPLAWIVSLLPITTINSSISYKALPINFLSINTIFKVLAGVAVVAILAIHGRDMFCNNCMSADWEGAPRFWDSGRALHLIPYDETKIGKAPEQL